MLAPVGNFLFTSWAVGFLPSEDSASWFRGLSYMQFTDWLTAGLLFLAGALLWKRHRFAWLLAILMLLGITILNVRIAFLFSEQDYSPSRYFQLWTNLLTTLSGFGILLYLRYPYVERRHGLFAPAARNQVVIPCQVQIGDAMVAGVLTSVSKSGGRVDFDPGTALPEVLPKEGLLVFTRGPSRNFKVIKKEENFLRVSWKIPLRDLPEWLKQQGIESSLARP